MKYMMLMQFSAAGTDFPSLDTWTPEEVQAHMAHVRSSLAALTGRVAAGPAE